MKLFQSIKRSRERVIAAAKKVTFVNAAIPTRITARSRRFTVFIEVKERSTGEPTEISLAWKYPRWLGPVRTWQPTSRDAIDWIYECVRFAWVHEINEAFFVKGKRLRDLHDEDGGAIAPPGELSPTSG